MNKSNLFKKAHALTKKIINTGDSYSATFALCLKEFYAQKNTKTIIKTTTTKKVAQATISFEEWVSDMHDLDVALLSWSEYLELSANYNKAVLQQTSKTNPKAIAKAKAERTTAKAMGIKALKGSAKQKAWAEQIRKEFLQTVTDENALSLVADSELTASAKFWIETRNVGIEKIAKAMSDLVVATKTANEIGAGNEGYNEQLEIRKQAMKVLGI